MKDDADSSWADRAGRGGGRAKPHGLVRPYVLGQGGGEPGRPVHREASESVPRSHQPTLDWLDDLDSRRSESAQAPEPARRSARNHRALQRRQRKLAAIGAGAAALVIAGGVVLFLSRPASKPLAGACDTAGC